MKLVLDPCVSFLEKQLLAESLLCPFPPPTLSFIDRSIGFHVPPYPCQPHYTVINRWNDTLGEQNTIIVSIPTLLDPSLAPPDIISYTPTPLVRTPERNDGVSSPKCWTMNVLVYCTSSCCNIPVLTEGPSSHDLTSCALSDITSFHYFLECYPCPTVM